MLPTPSFPKLEAGDLDEQGRPRDKGAKKDLGPNPQDDRESEQSFTEARRQVRSLAKELGLSDAVEELLAGKSSAEKGTLEELLKRLQATARSR